MVYSGVTIDNQIRIPASTQTAEFDTLRLFAHFADNVIEWKYFVPSQP